LHTPSSSSRNEEVKKSWTLNEVYCLYTTLIIPDDGGSTYLWNVGRQSFYTAVHPRRQFWTSYSPPWELKISHTCIRDSNALGGHSRSMVVPT
jgi:hypothetical protein